MSLRLSEVRRTHRHLDEKKREAIPEEDLEARELDRLAQEAEARWEETQALRHAKAETSE